MEFINLNYFGRVVAAIELWVVTIRTVLESIIMIWPNIFDLFDACLRTVFGVSIDDAKKGEIGLNIKWYNG